MKTKPLNDNIIMEKATKQQLTSLNQFHINNEDSYAEDLRTIGEFECEASNEERRTLQNSKSKPTGL